MNLKEEIRSRLDFRAFYQGELGELSNANGDGWTENMLCPFHDETDGSFGVNCRNGQFKCFGCGAKGSVFDFT